MKIFTAYFVLIVLAGGLFQGCASTTGIVDRTVAAEDKTEAQASRLVELAKKYYFEGSYPKVVTHLESYFAIEPESDSGWLSYILFYCYLHMGNYQLAYERARSLLAESPHESMAFTQVGLSQLWLDKPKLAVGSFERALEFDSRSPMNHFYLALAYEKLGKSRAMQAALDSVETELKQILGSNPNDVRANYGLAQVYLYSESKNDLVANLISAVDQALQSDADEDIVEERKLYVRYYLPLIRAKHLCHLGAAEESNDLLMKALEGAPSGIQADLAEIYYYFSKNYLQLKQPESASSFLKRAAQMDPTGPYMGRIERMKKKLVRCALAVC